MRNMLIEYLRYSVLSSVLLFSTTQCGMTNMNVEKHSRFLILPIDCVPIETDEERDSSTQLSSERDPKCESRHIENHISNDPKLQHEVPPIPDLGDRRPLDRPLSELEGHAKAKYSNEILADYEDWLQSFNEPLIQNTTSDDYEAYRFSFIGEDDAVVIRIEKNRNGIFILEKRSKDVYKVLFNKNPRYDIQIKKASERIWDGFEMLIEKYGFWEQFRPTTYISYDSVTWILEGAKGDQYQLIDVWNPERDDPTGVVEIGEFLMKRAR